MPSTLQTVARSWTAECAATQTRPCALHSSSSGMRPLSCRCCKQPFYRCNLNAMDSRLGSAVCCLYAVLSRKPLAVSAAAVVLQALKLNGSLLGCHRLRVTPSKTAIVPVKSDFLPRTDQERALCARTVYVANIDKKVDKEDVLAYFEKFCGEGCRQTLSDYSSHFAADPVNIRPLGVAHVSDAPPINTPYGQQVPASHCRNCHTAIIIAELLHNSQDLLPSAVCYLTITARPASLSWSLPSTTVPRTLWTAAVLSWGQCPFV